MGWERRARGGRYYVQKRWEGGRVRSRYIGRGKAAELIASMDQADAARRAEERRLTAAARERFAAFDRQYIALDAQIRAYIAEVLREAGYHQHKRQWRKRRERTDSERSPRTTEGGPESC